MRKDGEFLLLQRELMLWDKARIRAKNPIPTKPSEQELLLSPETEIERNTHQDSNLQTKKEYVFINIWTQKKGGDMYWYFSNSWGLRCKKIGIEGFDSRIPRICKEKKVARKEEGRKKASAKSNNFDFLFSICGWVFFFFFLFICMVNESLYRLGLESDSDMKYYKVLADFFCFVLFCFLIN